LRKGFHITDEGLLEALRARVPNWWLPDAIVRVAAMPLATTGKIDKTRLRAEHG
jgi:3-(methylthio)propionyl---CoA ligase